MSIHFSKEIEFEDGNKELIEFSAEFITGNESFEHFGNKGFKQETSLEEITFEETGLTKEQIKYIEDLVNKGELDTMAWDSLENS